MQRHEDAEQHNRYGQRDDKYLKKFSADCFSCSWMPFLYPFTAPLVMPAIIYFCMKMNISETGMIVTMANAVR